MTHTSSLPMDRLLHLKDQFGNDMYFSNTEVRIPAVPSVPDFSKQLNNIRDVELRPDDIMTVGYPKSGNNWIHHMVSMLQAGTTDLPDIFSNDNFPLLEAFNDVDAKLPPLDHPRVLFSHLPLHFLPREVVEKKIKIVLITRNPKDVFVSLFNHLHNVSLPFGYEGTWNQFFTVMLEQGFWYGHVFDYMKKWQADIEAHPDLPVFICNYEDCKRDTLGQVERLNEALGTGRSRELCKAIVDTCQLRNMTKSRSQSYDTFKKTWMYKDGKCFESFYRKGVAGDWKNWFTVAQNEEFDATYADQMADFKLKFDMI